MSSGESSSSSDSEGGDEYSDREVSIRDEYLFGQRDSLEVKRKKILSKGSAFRRFLYHLIESNLFKLTVLLVITLNTLIIGLETSELIVAKSQWYFMMLNQIFVSIYVLETAMKLYVWRLFFFRQPWNNLDFIIVFASTLEFIFPLINNFDDDRVTKVLSLFSALRALRAVRVLRTIRFLKGLQIIVTTLLKSIPALGNIVLLISLVLYTFAIIGRSLYGDVDTERFGNLAKAIFTLFQLMTLDDWFLMYTDVRDSHPSHWHILIYLIIFIVLETFIFLNLFVAVIVDNLARTQAAANIKKLAKKTQHKIEYDETEATVNELARHKTVSARSMKPVDSYYSQSDKDQKLKGKYLVYLASLEHHLTAGHNHQHTLNELVDLLDFSKQ